MVGVKFHDVGGCCSLGEVGADRVAVLWVLGGGDAHEESLGHEGPLGQGGAILCELGCQVLEVVGHVLQVSPEVVADDLLFDHGSCCGVGQGSAGCEAVAGVLDVLGEGLSGLEEVLQDDGPCAPVRGEQDLS